MSHSHGAAEGDGRGGPPRARQRGGRGDAGHRGAAPDGGRSPGGAVPGQGLTVGGPHLRQLGPGDGAVRHCRAGAPERIRRRGELVAGPDGGAADLDLDPELLVGESGQIQLGGALPELDVEQPGGRCQVHVPAFAPDECPPRSAVIETEGDGNRRAGHRRGRSEGFLVGQVEVQIPSPRGGSAAEERCSRQQQQVAFHDLSPFRASYGSGQ